MAWRHSLWIFTKLAGAVISALLAVAIGATNMRTGVASLYWRFDAGRGTRCRDGRHLFADAHSAAFVGLVVVIGHCFPVWLKFVGGKGIALASLYLPR